MTFGKFKGIQKEREIKNETKALEVMLEFCDKFVEKYKNKVNIDESDDNNNVYARMMQKLQKSLPEFNEGDIRSLIFARVNQEYDERDEDGYAKEALALGLYTSCLLDLLALRNREKEKSTAFYIDGKNNAFDFLFTYVRHVDELIIENFRGQCICSNAAYEGNIKTVMVNNIKGDALLESAANYGTIDMCILENINGTRVLHYAGHEDTIKLIAANDIKGVMTLSKCEANTLLYKSIKAEDFKLNEIKNALSIEYVKEQLKGSHLYQILELLDSKEGKTPEEKIKIARKIHEIYKNVQ